MREADRAELEAASEGWDGPLHALLTSFSMTPESVALEIDDLPAAILGIAPYPQHPRIGCPWLLGTDALAEHKVWFVRETRACLSALSKDSFDVLYNDVDVRYAKAVRWLEFLNFAVVGVVEGRPPERIPFLRMEKHIGSGQVQAGAR
jgi:hypothetical protein